MRRNEPELWDELWNGQPSTDEDLHVLVREAQSIRWQRMERRIVERFGDCGGLRVVELGAGAGTHAALLAQRGADVTVLDFSARALERSRSFFERNRVRAEHVLADATALADEWTGACDVSMSFGLAEHFTGDMRRRVIRAHLDVLRKGGVAFVSVPNRWNLPYRLYKFLAEKRGTWPYGQEVPYSRRELAAIMRDLGVREYGFFGDSLIGSLRFFPAPPYLRKGLARWSRPLCGAGRGGGVVRFERGTPLDGYLSYALVLYAEKP